MRKKFFLAFFTFILFLMQHQTIAQENDLKFDISAGYGLITSNDFVYVTRAIEYDESILEDLDFENARSSGSLFVSYKSAGFGKLYMGVSFGYEVIKEDVFYQDDHIGELTSRYFTLSYALDYRYIFKEYFQMYSGAAIAYTSYFTDWSGEEGLIDDGIDGFLNFQLTGVGFRVGKKFGGIAEIGFGYKGILVLGVSAHF